MAMLDEALFKVPGLIDFEASVRRRGEHATLTIAAQSAAGPGHPLEPAIFEALGKVHAIYLAQSSGRLAIVAGTRYGVEILEPRAEKRTIEEQDGNGE
jgi:hypothetical protein